MFQWFRQHGFAARATRIHTPIVVGLITHTCIEATVRYTAEPGYVGTVVKNATADYSDKEMQAALEVKIPNERLLLSLLPNTSLFLSERRSAKTFHSPCPVCSAVFDYLSRRVAKPIRRDYKMKHTAHFFMRSATGILAIALSVGSLAVRGTAQNLVPGSNGKIAFSRDGKNGQNNIWVINPDGTGAAQITQSGLNGSPAWSPDATKLAIQRSLIGGILHFEIFVMRADGTGLVQLTNNATNSSFNPTWSPDGTKIAYASGPDQGQTSDIYVVNSDGTGSPTNLTNDSTHFNVSPAWSPDGSKIAFDSGRAGSEDIWVMNADGTSQTNLTGGFVVAGDGRLSQDRWPAWSPDSSKIAFYTNADGLEVFHIYVMNSDGTSPYAQTTSTSVSGSNGLLIFDFAPAWSPDGNYMAFGSDRSGIGNDIYVMSALSSESATNVPVNISNVGAHSAANPNWSVVPTPCGKKVCHF